MLSSSPFKGVAEKEGRGRLDLRLVYLRLTLIAEASAKTYASIQDVIGSLSLFCPLVSFLSSVSVPLSRPFLQIEYSLYSPELAS